MSDTTAKPANDDAADYVKRVENIDRQVEDIMDAAREECVDLKLDRNQIFKDAKSAGHSVKVIKAAVKQRKAQRKMDADINRLSLSDRDRVEMIIHALGDLAGTPLGAAAVQAAA